MADHLRTVIDSLSPEDQAEVAGFMAASSETERREVAYMAALPGRMAGIGDMISDLLPEGLRFEWGPADA
ncbi:MAG: hypothetical protein ACLQI7_24825 [Streptosporangiaceae bacterium]